MQDDEEEKKLREALAKTLQVGGDEDDDENDDDMTDSEMAPLDDKLVEIFKQMKKAPNKKKEQKDAKETMINFKSRVLDLLNIYAKRQASNPLVFELLLPLLRLSRTTKAKHLSDRSRDIIGNIQKFTKKEKTTDGATIELLQAVHAEASKDQSKAFAKAASAASLTVSAALFREGTIEEVFLCYAATGLAKVKGEVAIQPAFLVDFAQFAASYTAS